MDLNLMKKRIVIMPSRMSGMELRKSLAMQYGDLANVETETLLGLAEKALYEKYYEGYKLIDELIGVETLQNVLLSLKCELGCFSNLSHDPQTALAFYRAILDIKLCWLTTDPVYVKSFMTGQKADDLQLIIDKYSDIMERNKYLDRADALHFASDQNICTKYVQFFVPKNLYLYPLEHKWLQVVTGGVYETLSLEDLPRKLAIRPIERGSTTDATKPGDSKNTWKIVKGYGENNELRYLLRHMKQYSFPLDECLVCCTDYATYAKTLYNLSLVYNIPMTFSRGVDLADTVPGQLTKSLLRWFQNGFKASDFKNALFSNEVALGKFKQYFLPKVKEKIENDYGNEDLLGQGLVNLCSVEAENGKTVFPLEDLLSIGYFYNIIQDLLPQWAAPENQAKFDERKKLVIEEYKDAADQKNQKKLIQELSNIVWVELFFEEFAQKNNNDGILFSKSMAWFLGNFLWLRYSDREEKDRYSELPKDNLLLQDKQAQKLLLNYLEHLHQSDFPKDYDTERQLLHYFVQHTRVFASGSRPGHLHVTDISTGLWVWRKHVFFAGLDANRFPGKSYEDPVLLDDERKHLFDKAKYWYLIKRDRFKINKIQMDNLRKHHQKTANDLVFSYTDFNLNDIKSILPSSELLNIYSELNKENDTLTYEIFKKRFLEEEAPQLIKTGFIPDSQNLLDGAEFWLAHTQGGRKSLPDVTELYPTLENAIEMLGKKRGPQLSEYDGKIIPLKNTAGKDVYIGAKIFNVGISPSALENLGACPFLFFVSRLLNLKTYDTRKEGVNQWLNAGERGTLLHKIYEVFLNEIYSGSSDYTKDDLLNVIEEIARVLANKKEKRLRPESEQVFEMELESILSNAALFINDFEWENYKKYQSEGNIKSISEEKFEVTVPLEESRKIPLKGFIDRVLISDEKCVKIIDYKTGKGDKFKDNVFSGGRKLQAPVYALAYETLNKDTDMDVVESNYHFINHGTKKQRVVNEMKEMQSKTLSLLDTLYKVIEKGEFAVTDNERTDCGYCDYKLLCSRDLLENIESKRMNLYAEEVRSFE